MSECSAIQRHQSPERSIVSQFSAFMQLQIQGREITLDGFHPGTTQLPWWTSPALRRRPRNECSNLSNILTYLLLRLSTTVCSSKFLYCLVLSNSSRCYWQESVVVRWRAKTAVDLRRHINTHNQMKIACEVADCTFHARYYWEMNLHCYIAHDVRSVHWPLSVVVSVMYKFEPRTWLGCTTYKHVFTAVLF